MSVEAKKKWYKTKWGILLIVLFAPIILMGYLTRLIWRQKWNKGARIAAIVALWGFVLIVGASNDKSTTTGSQQNPAANSFQKGFEAATEPTNTPKPAEKYNIVVTSQIVKKVDGKYRYFFDIRNKDTKPFEGDVSIALFTSELKNPIAGDAFSTTKAIEPELGTSVNADANTGPASINGANGITKFTYTVRKGNEIVKTGEGVITDKFEDVDSYGF
jgi:hypothetical protein